MKNGMQRGLTRFEALIISFLILIIILMLPPAMIVTKSKMRDQQRVSDIEELATSLQRYFVLNNNFPISDTWININGQDPVSQQLKKDGGGAFADPISPNFDYTYISDDGKSYIIKFCMENNQQNFKRGCINKIEFKGI